MRALRTIAPKVVVAAALTALVACGETGAAEPSQNESFWEPIRISGDEVEGYASLAEMATSADLVARGKVLEIGVSREITTDVPEDVVTYGVMVFSPTEVLRGTGPDPVPIEFLVNVPSDDVDSTIAEQADSAPSGDMVVFLREKGAAEEGLYRLVNSYGLWVETDGGLTAPVAEDPAVARDLYETELAATGDLDDLARALGR